MAANIAIPTATPPLRRVVRLIGLCGLLGLAGCATQPQATAYGPPVTGPGRPGVSLQALIDGALHPPLGTARPAVLDSLDLPNRIGLEPRRRPGAPAADTLRTLYYDGLQVSVYEMTRSGKELITGVTATDSVYKTAQGLHVGSTRAEVEAVLDAPVAVADSAYAYRLSEASRLYLRFDRGRVAEMRWSFFEP